MSIMRTIDSIARDYRARRRRLATYLEISSLPLEIQKDIGWPDFTDGREELARPRRRVGGNGGGA